MKCAPKFYGFSFQRPLCARLPSSSTGTMKRALYLRCYLCYQGKMRREVMCSFPWGTSSRPNTINTLTGKLWCAQKVFAFDTLAPLSAIVVACGISEGSHQAFLLFPPLSEKIEERITKEKKGNWKRNRGGKGKKGRKRKKKGGKRRKGRREKRKKKDKRKKKRKKEKERKQRRQKERFKQCMRCHRQKDCCRVGQGYLEYEMASQCMQARLLFSARYRATPSNPTPNMADDGDWKRTNTCMFGVRGSVG